MACQETVDWQVGKHAAVLYKQRLTRGHTFPKPTCGWEHINTCKHKHTSHETNSGTEGDKCHKPEEGSDCFTHMWQESTWRKLGVGGRWQSRQSDKHARQSYRCTDGENWQTHRQTVRQADWYFSMQAPAALPRYEYLCTSTGTAWKWKTNWILTFQKTTTKKKRKPIYTYVTSTCTKPVHFRCGDSDIWLRDRRAVSQIWS